MMQASGADESHRGEDVREPKAEKAEDEWGAFYSMPPKWKKDDTTPSKSGLTDENIGHRLASLLRYHLDEFTGINIDEQGWVLVDEILEHADEVGLSRCTAEDLVRVVESNEHSTRGKRFESDGAGRIKATYRHPPKDRRNDRWDRNSRRSGGYSRGIGQRGYNSWGNGWDDSSKWGEGWSDQGQEAWDAWKKPGFSPAPDDVIVKESSWSKSAEKPAAQVEIASQEAGLGDQKVACEWEQWFTPDSMEMYFYNTQTEEVFFPGDAAECEEKGWSRYVETEGARTEAIYWWHEATSKSFYEEDTAGDDEEAAEA